MGTGYFLNDAGCCSMCGLMGRDLNGHGKGKRSPTSIPLADANIVGCAPLPEEGSPKSPQSPEPVKLEKPPKKAFPFFCCKRRARGAASPTAQAGASESLQLGAFGLDADGASSHTLDALDAGKRAKMAELRRLLDALPASEAFPKRHDLWLKRFLTHGKWKLDKAFELYSQMEAWRREVGADTILQEHPDGRVNEVLQMDLIGFYPYSCCRKNRAIAWMKVGHTPWWRALFERTDLTLRSQLWMGEWYEASVAGRAKQTGEWRERSVVLVDLSDLDFNYFQGVSSSSRTRRRGAEQTCAQYYPGIVDRAYVLHAPGFANKAWSILKHFLSQALMEKAVMVGSNEELRQMLDDLGPENVPRALGGCSDAPTHPLPEHLKMPAGGWGKVIEAWRPREICVRKGARHQEVLHVPAGGSCRWQWALTCASIGFEVTRRAVGGPWETVEEMRECTFFDTEEPVFGEAKAPAGAACEFCFAWDNESSVVRSKTLLLRLEQSSQ